jgi:hypothetical protein
MLKALIFIGTSTVREAKKLGLMNSGIFVVGIVLTSLSDD